MWDSSSGFPGRLFSHPLHFTSLKTATCLAETCRVHCVYELISVACSYVHLLALLLYICDECADCGSRKVRTSCNITVRDFRFTRQRLWSAVILNVTSCSLVEVQPSLMTSWHFATSTPHIRTAGHVSGALLGFGISHDSEIWESSLSRDCTMTQNGAMSHIVSSSSVTYIVWTKMAQVLLRTSRKSGKYKLN